MCPCVDPNPTSLLSFIIIAMNVLNWSLEVLESDQTVWRSMRFNSTESETSVQFSSQSVQSGRVTVDNRVTLSGSSSSSRDSGRHRELLL